MKKVMICAITLLPLILLLTLFVSTAIIGFSTYVYVSSVEFVEEEVYLKKTDGSDVTQQLKVNIFPLQADNKEIEYWSDDTNIATIDADGNVTSVNFGSTYVRVRSKEKPSLQSACKVIVTDEKIHSLTIVDMPDTLFFGESTEIKCSYVPTDATNIDLLYKSSDESLASVAQDGIVTANNQKGGYVTITAWSKANPLASAEATVKICGRIQSIDFEDHADVFSAKRSFELPQITIYPDNAIWGNDVKYSISDESIAKIENNAIVFKKAGMVTLTVKDDYGHEVKKKYESTWGYYDFISFTESSTEITRNFEDYSSDTPLEFSYTATPSDATANIVLNSDNPSVICVRDGKFYVCGGGKATISMQITTCSGNVVNTTLAVTIKRKAESIDFTDTSGRGGMRYATSLDGRLQINTSVLPSDSTDNITYSLIEGGDFASVNSQGLVTFNTGLTQRKAVTVRATTDSGVYRDIQVAYIPPSANPQEVVDDGELSLWMPLSHLEQKISLEAYCGLYSDKEITFEVIGDGGVVDGSAVVITKTGTFVLNAKKDGNVIASTTITVARRVESVSAELYATWTGKDDVKWSGESTFYTSSKNILIKNIVILPENSSVLTSDGVKVSDEGIASVCESDGNYSVKFNKAGTVELSLTVGDAVFKATIASTYGLLDDKAVVEIYDNKEVESGSTLAVSDLVGVKTASPVNGDIANTSISIMSGSATLSEDKQSVKFTVGGKVELQISYDTVSGTKFTNKITVLVKEEPTDIELGKGAFVVTESGTIDLTALFDVLPTTANHNTTASYSLSEEYSYATLTGKNLTFTDAGIAVVTISLANGISKNVAIAYYGDYSEANVALIDGRKYVERGSSFAIRLTDEMLSTLTAESNFACDNGKATITNGLIVTANQAGMFGISIASQTYEYESVVKAVGVAISLVDSTKADLKTDGTYITGLSSIALSANVLGEDVTYSGVTYAVDNDCATVSDEGILTFTRAGRVIVTASDKFGKNASITIESTYGSFTSITATEESLTLDYDDANLATGYDFSTFFSGYPTQLSVSENATIEVTVSEGGASASVSGFAVSLNGRSNFKVTCKQAEASASIDVVVNRKATSVSINGTSIDDISSESAIDIASSFIYLRFTPIPSDANQYVGVSATIDDAYSGKASVSELNSRAWRLTFVEQDVIVPLTFVYANGISKTLKFTTTQLSRPVDFNSNPIVVMKDELFKFSNEDLNLSDLVLSGGDSSLLEKSGSNYRITKGGRYTISGTNNGIEFAKDIIVTSAFEEFSDVKINDVNHSETAVSVDIAKAGKHSTASKELSVSFAGIGDAFNVDGSTPTVQYQSDNESIARIDANGSITFLCSGTVTITLTVSGETYSVTGDGEYSVDYSFMVYSSYGRVDDFVIQNAGTTQNVIIDDTSDYTLVCTPTAPANYGTFIQNFEYVSSNIDIATVQNGIVSFHNTGKVTINVETTRGDGSINTKSITFNIDKLVDDIKVVDGNEKQRSQIVVNTSTYQLLTDLSSMTKGARSAGASTGAIEPTLTTLTYSVKGGTSGCSIDSNGLITFDDGVTGKFVIVIKAQGSADTEGVQCELPIVKVASTVSIITIDVADASYSAFEAGKSYVIDAGFGSSVPEVIIPSSVGVADELGVFTTIVGTQATIQIKYTDEVTTVNAYVEQAVQSIVLKESAPQSTYGGAITFNLTEMFGASVYPSTAGRVVDGKLEYYTVQYGVDDATVARVVGNADGEAILEFIKAGTVTITFSAGGKSESAKIQSTFGYADGIVFAQNNRDFYFTDGSYTFATSDYTVTPSDADPTKYNLAITSSDTNVLAVDGLKVSFVGGGEATLTFKYKMSSATEATVTVTVRVVKYADGISVSCQGKETQNVLTAEDNLSLTTIGLGEKLSPYTIEYTSLDSSVASVDSNGWVKILQKGVACQITVKLISQYDSHIEASKTITVRQAPYSIKEIGNSNGVYEFNYGDFGNHLSLYYTDFTLPTTFAITDKNGAPTTSSVLSTDSYGDVTLLSAGSVFITATDPNEQRKTFEIRVYKQAEDIVFSDNLDAYFADGEYVMAGTSVKLFDASPLDAILPLGASFGKTVEYSYDSSIATIDASGNVTFLTKNTLVVTVLVKRAGEIDYSKEIKLRSTLGTAITAKMYKDGVAIASNYSINVGDSIVFNVGDIKPSDLQLTSSNFTAVASTTNVVSIAVDVTGKKITVTGIGKGVCDVIINVAGQTFSVNVTSILKVDSVHIQYNNKTVTTLKTLNPQFKLTAVALPANANNTSVKWILPAGITMDADNNFVITGGQGTYSIQAIAEDGSGCSAIIEVVYEDLVGFGLQFGDTEVQSNHTEYLAYNQNSLTFTLLPYPNGLQGVLIGDFELQSVMGYSYGIIRDQTSMKITLTTPEAQNELHFEDEVVITYKGLYSFRFFIYRSGVQSVSFKYYNPLADAGTSTNADLDNALDSTFGYQQLRVFGNYSYYNGIQGYYKMYIEVKPRQDYLQYVEFTAQKGLTITRDASDNSFVYVNFNGYTGSSLNSFLADLAYDGSDGVANVSATDVGATLGSSAYSYDFHVVSGVNVFDKAGYLNGGGNVVLHVNLTHDDEEAGGGISNRSRFDGYATSSNSAVINKSVLYGNGYLINFANKNNYKTNSKNVPEAETSYGFTSIIMSNVINAKLKGTNDIVAGNSNRDYYYIEIGDVDNMYYTEAYNMLRVIDNYNRRTNIKRCLFRTTAESGAISSYKDGFVDANSMNFTDVIMFDTGSRAIETHSNPIRVYGFLDVYNFQNKETLNKELIGVSIGNGVFGEIKNDHGEFIETVNGEMWFNMVALSAKGDDKILYYNDVVVPTNATAENGLKKAKISYALGIYKFSIWGYPVSDTSIKWSDQYKSDGSLDNGKMMSTTWKITRTQQQSL